MQASLILGPHAIEMRDVPMPEPKNGEILLKMLNAGICGSDLGNYHRGTARDAVPQPGQCGHEFVGEVIDTSVPNVRTGQRLLVMPPRSNAFAEFLAVPPDCTIPVPDSLESPVALLAQQLGTVLHAMRFLPPLLDQTVAVVGAGPAGLSFAQMAIKMGARAVYSVENRPARREVALNKIGVDRAVASEGLSELLDLLGGGSDVAIDAAGGQSAIDTAYRLVKKGGHVLRFGLPHGATTFDHELAIRKEVNAHHAVGAQQEPNLACFRLAMRLIERGEVDPTKGVSHHMTLAQVPDALALADDPNGNAIKIVIHPNS
ncbi:MAG: zinc-binding dehydrogenase [Chloroflexi bacterium]|nr:zinc-binding dehydrogenase [Chloroflexota bacterium]